MPDAPDSIPEPPLDEEELLAALVEEFQERHSKGEAITVASFAAEHPEMEEELLSLLPAVVDMDSLGRVSRPPVPSTASYPDQLGDYRLLNKLGSGGMGTVFRALQESLKREVAVKVLAPAWNSDSRHSEAFENESRLIAGLRHTNIVEVYGAGREGQYRYYVMALVNGRGLSAGLLGRCFPGVPHNEAVAKVGYQAARALAFAHSHGVLHRDVKPGNLLLDDDGVVHVSDFGLATALNAGEEAPLVTQSLEGTLRYMSPERLLRGVNSFSGDQYGLGLTLYELVRKAPAFSETDPGKLINTICNSPVPPLRHAGELGAIINKAISYSERDRYASVEDMADDLRRYLEGEPVKARPASLWRRYALWVRRRPAVAVWSHAAALLVFMLFVSVSWGYARVSRSLRNENMQRLIAENNVCLAESNKRMADKNAQLAEHIAQAADAALLRIFSGVSLMDKVDASPGAADDDDAVSTHTPSLADARLMLDLMPYYEEIAAKAEQGDSKVSQACRILADISLQAGEYSTAEIYYRRVLESEKPYTPAAMAATNGLASALYAQRKRDDARKLLLACVDGLPADASYEARLAAVHSLQLVAGYGATANAQSSNGWTGSGTGPDSQDSSDGWDGQAKSGKRAGAAGFVRNRFAKRIKYLEKAAALLKTLLDERPEDPKARLRRVELLSSARSEKVRRMLAPDGETPQTLLTELLREEPDSREYQRAFVRLALRNRKQMDGESIKQAAEYAATLLSDHPADGAYIILYIGARDAYTSYLARQGKAQEAQRENERTLGVLAFLTSRADFSDEMRDRLLAVVSHRSSTGQDAHRNHDAELRTLLRDYDAHRMSALRRMLRERQPKDRTGVIRPPLLPSFRPHHTPDRTQDQPESPQNTPSAPTPETGTGAVPD